MSETVLPRYAAVHNSVTSLKGHSKEKDSVSTTTQYHQLPKHLAMKFRTGTNLIESSFLHLPKRLLAELQKQLVQACCKILCGDIYRTRATAVD